MSSMPLLGLTFAAAAALASPVAAQSQVSPTSQVQQHLRALDTMTAQFTQTDGKGGTLTGGLTLKRPGKIRFQYQKGVPILIIGDGTALIIIDYQVRQDSRVPIGSSPLSALLNPDRDLSKVAKVSSLTDDKNLILDAHDPKHPESGTYRFSFARVPSAPAGLMLQGWTVLDTQGKQTTVRLAGQRLNVPVSEKAFKWVDPRLRSR